MHTYCIQVTPHIARYFPVTFSIVQPYVSYVYVMIVHGHEGFARYVCRGLPDPRAEGIHIRRQIMNAHVASNNNYVTLN